MRLNPKAAINTKNWLLKPALMRSLAAALCVSSLSAVLYALAVTVVISWLLTKHKDSIMAPFSEINSRSLRFLFSSVIFSYDSYFFFFSSLRLFLLFTFTLSPTFVWQSATFSVPLPHSDIRDGKRRKKCGQGGKAWNGGRKMCLRLLAQ